MIIRRLPCLKSMDRSWRSQDIPGRRSLKVGSSVGAGVGRWWRATTGCDPSALIRMALRVGNFGRNGACVAGAAPALPPTEQRYAPPVASPVELSSRLATLRPVLPGQIDCLIAHLSADAETRNPRPDIVWPVGLEWACNKNSADADCMYPGGLFVFGIAPAWSAAVCSAHPLNLDTGALLGNNAPGQGTCSAMGLCLPRPTPPPPSCSLRPPNNTV